MGDSAFIDSFTTWTSSEKWGRVVIYHVVLIASLNLERYIWILKAKAFVGLCQLCYLQFIEIKRYLKFLVKNGTLKIIFPLSHKDRIKCYYKNENMFSNPHGQIQKKIR